MNLLDEDPLAADGRERRVLPAVAVGGDGDDLDRDAATFDRCRHRPGLPQRESTSARTDAQHDQAVRLPAGGGSPAGGSGEGRLNSRLSASE